VFYRGEKLETMRNANVGATLGTRYGDEGEDDLGRSPLKKRIEQTRARAASRELLSFSILVAYRGHSGRPPSLPFERGRMGEREKGEREESHEESRACIHLVKSSRPKPMPVPA